MLRAMERTALRGRLGVTFSEGFNPRPVVSLACPRPVGVASLEDLVVTRLTGEWSAPDILHRLGTHAPAGMTFHRAGVLHDKQPPQPRRAEFELLLPPRQRQTVARRLEELAPRDAWPIERMISVKGHGPRKGRFPRTVDLRPLVERVELLQDRLRWAFVPVGEAWARPGEWLGLVGLDGRVDLARVVRTAVTYRPEPQTPDPASQHPPNEPETPQGEDEDPI